MIPTDERGTSSVETLVVVSLLIALTATIVQAGLYYHARNVARSAAASCAETVRTLGGSSSAGIAAGNSLIAQGTGLTQPRVAVSATAVSVTCTVTGSAPKLAPLPLPPIAQQATAPKERITQP